MSDSVRPHRQQPTRLPHPWDSLVKNTGVGCHFLLQCMKVKSESEVAQSCPPLRDPMDLQPTRLLRPWDFSRQEYWSGVPLPSLKNYLSDNINLFCKINHNPIITDNSPYLRMMFNFHLMINFKRNYDSCFRL